MEQFEDHSERIPSKEEVLDVLDVLAKGEKFDHVRERFDDKGLYLLEIKIDDPKTGESIHFEYRRKGKYPEGATASTVVNIEFYSDGQYVNGHNVADLDPKTGMWLYI